MKVSEFDFALPGEHIAQRPVEPRDAARMMVLPLKGGETQHRFFYDLPLYLTPGDVLVLNETKVLPARLRGRKPTGGIVEVLLVRPLENRTWECLVRPGGKVREGTVLSFGSRLMAKVGETSDHGGRLVEFDWQGDWMQVLQEIGEIPLPPYIKNRDTSMEDYQTVYATTTGSVAAPTAGLHFTPRLLQEIRNKGVFLARLLLHVGPGTFQPVKVSEVETHRMHPEYYQVEESQSEVINRARAAGHRVVAVGTTAARTLETVTSDGYTRASSGWTEIFIYPGYSFTGLDGLITNFHLPRSTLTMLASALVGRERLMSAYYEAMETGYRFYSFGDAMLII